MKRLWRPWNVLRNYLVKIVLSGCVLLLTACGQSAAPDSESFPPELIEENACTFDDGTTASLWQSGFSSHHYYYQLENETHLLEFWDYTDPDYVLSCLEGSAASPEAKEAICSYYGNVEPVHDKELLLRDAYEDYLLCAQEDIRFRTHAVGTEVSLTAETSRFVSCVLTDTQPDSSRFDGTVTETRIPILFDRSTGEIIPMWDAFQLPEAEAKEEVLALCSAIARPEEMEQAIDSAYLIWYPDTLEIWFPAGSLQNQDIAAGGGFSYEELEGLLEPWAIPSVQD